MASDLIVLLGVAMTAVVFFGGGLLLGVSLARRSLGQSVAASRPGQSVVPFPPSPPAIQTRSPPLEPLTAAEEAAWAKQQRVKILERVTAQYPHLTTARREAIADEILAKGRATLARIR